MHEDLMQNVGNPQPSVLEENAETTERQAADD